MTSQAPKQCQHCASFYLPHEEEEHLNMHIDPHKLAPKTSPNDMRKIELAKVIVAEDPTDVSDIALRSLLPDEIPKPEEDRKKMRAPDNTDQLRNDSIFDPHAGRGNDANNYNRVRDRLDLTSKLATTDLSKDQLNKLEIEKQVEIKTIKTVVPKKEIHKFQNSHYSGKETKDLGGCDRKVMPNGLNGSNANNAGEKVGSGNGPFSGSGVVVGSGFGLGGQGGQGGQGGSRVVGGAGENELGYEVKADNTYLTNPSKKSTVVVPINRRTGNPNEFKPVDTKANQEESANKRPSYNNNNSRVGGGKDEEYSQKLSNSQNAKNNSKVKEYDPNNQGGMGGGYPNDHNGMNGKNGHNGGHTSHYHGNQGGHGSQGNHLHHHECPSCHGFYCQHCGSTIPPEYRPFWDPDESPEMVEYYKKRVRECRDKEREREKKEREGCGECNSHKQQENAKRPF